MSAPPSPSPSALPYLIVGAGPSGLAAARAFAQAGLPFEVVERQGDVGGIWDATAERTPMYESAHFISSRTQSAFDGFPMPDDYPDYPGWRQIRDYIRAFADAHDLRRHVRFHTEVERAVPLGTGAERGGEWEVRFAGGGARRYRGVVAASGHNWDPLLPSYPGAFDGEAYHSFHYTSAEQFRGRRVLVVGGGNSGCDIACDAAATADRAFISLRRGYHFLPKHVFGTPTDAFFRSGPELPTWLAQPALTLLLRLLHGDLTRYGLPKPDHKVLESHPIMNTQLLHYLAHGDITAKPDVKALREDRVVFADGSEEAVDTIVWATGYRPTLAWLPNGTLPKRTGIRNGDGGVPELFLNIFPDGAGAPRNLFVLGLFETDGAAYPIVSKQAALVAAVIRARDAGGAKAAAWERIERGPRPDLTHGVKYVHSPRHSIYVQFDVYGKLLTKLVKQVG